MEREVNPMHDGSPLQAAEAMIALSRGGFHPDPDGGLSEADVTRTVRYLKRFRAAAEVTAVLAAMGVGAVATLVFLVLTRNAGGEIGV